VLTANTQSDASTVAIRKLVRIVKTCNTQAGTGIFHTMRYNGLEKLVIPARWNGKEHKGNKERNM